MLPQYILFCETVNDQNFVPPSHICFRIKKSEFMVDTKSQKVDEIIMENSFCSLKVGLIWQTF